MKVVNLITQMEAGGAQGAAVRMSRALNEEHHEAETWFLHSKRPVYADEPNVRTLLKGKASVISIFRILVTLYDLLKKYNPDVIITYTHYANIIGSVVAKLAGIKTRIVSQRSPSYSYPPIAKVLDKWIGSTKLYTSNICVSQHVYDSFSSYPESYRSKLKVVYNGVFIQHSSLSKDAAREKFSLDKKSKLIITTGRLSYPKNHEFLIDLVHRLPPDYHLVIAGEGELRSEIESLIVKLKVTGKVTLLGEILPRDIPDFLKAGDLFVFPSRYEAFGFSLVEAMAAGLPVIVNDIPPLRYIVNKYGHVVSVDNVEVWKEKIVRLGEDEKDHDEYSEKAKRRSEDFSLESMVAGYLELAHK